MEESHAEGHKIEELREIVQAKTLAGKDKMLEAAIALESAAKEYREQTEGNEDG